MSHSPIEDYLRLRPVRFPDLLDFSSRQRLEGPGYRLAGNRLELVFCDVSLPLTGSSNLLICQFVDVMNLMITTGLIEAVTGPLDIDDMRMHQLEEIKFRVQDIEHERLRFECRDFSCRLVTLQEHYDTGSCPES